MSDLRKETGAILQAVGRDIASLFGPSLRKQALAAISSHPMTPRPDANIHPIYVKRFNAYLEFTRRHKGNGHDVAMYCALGDYFARMDDWYNSCDALPDKPADQKMLETMARLLSFSAGLILAAQWHAEKATHGQIVASDIDLAFQKMRLGSQMLRQKGWLGFHAEEAAAATTRSFLDNLRTKIRERRAL